MYIYVYIIKPSGQCGLEMQSISLVYNEMIPR